jgi:phasin family protein
MMNTEHLIAAHKANVEALFGLTNKAFEGVEKLVELNLQVAKAAIGEAGDGARAVLSVKDAQELMTLQANLLQPTAEKAAAYSRHVYDIAAATQVEFTKAVEAQISDAQAKFMGLVDSAAKNAPAGSENAVALMRSAVTAASNAFDSVQTATKQATEVAEANLKAMTATATKTAAAKVKRA